jgi:hypothetical protein
MFAESGTETCGAADGNLAPHFQPNCVSRRKSAEGPMVENAYNDCGYRTPTPCGTHAPGTIRVALMGTSIAEGFRVPYEETFAARLTVSLSRACGRPVEFQNMGVAGAGLLDVYRRTGEAMAMRPDLIMLVVSAIELKDRMSRAELSGRDEPLPPPTPSAAPPPRRTQPLVSWLSDQALASRALVVAQHFLLQDRESYVRLYMLHGEEADYLRRPLSQAWQERLTDFGQVVGDMVSRARSRDVPLLVVWAPTRIQAALVADAARPEPVDPFLFDRRLAEVSTQRGATFLDALEGFARHRAPERFFYPVDGHLNGDGAAVFADVVRERLTLGDIAPFSGCAAARSGAGGRAPSPS